MEMNFLKQNPCISSCSGVFQFDIFFSVFFFSCSMCISALGPSPSPSSSLVISFIHSAFSLCFLIAIFSSKIVRFLWRLVVGMFFCHALPVFDRIFFLSFGMSCFVCIVLSFVKISLISLLSPEFLVYFFKLYCYFFLVLSSSFCSYIFPDLSVSLFWPVIVNFFFIKFLILVLSVCSCFLKPSSFLSDIYHYFLIPSL